MNQQIQKQSRKTVQTEGLGQITRQHAVTLVKLESRVTDIVERMIVLEGAIKEYRRNQQK